MKPITVALAMALAGAPALAQAADRNYAGLGLGTFSHKLSVNSTNKDVSTDDEADFVGIGIGHISSDWRAHGTFHVADLENNDTVWWLAAGYDHLFNEGSALQPFAGGHFGYYKFSDNSSDLAINAITIGPEAGVQLRVDPFIAEVGGRYGIGINSNDNTNGDNYSLDYVQTLYISLSTTF